MFTNRKSSKFSRYICILFSAKSTYFTLSTVHMLHIYLVKYYSIQ